MLIVLMVLYGHIRGIVMYSIKLAKTKSSDDRLGITISLYYWYIALPAINKDGINQLDRRTNWDMPSIIQRWDFTCF